MLVADGKGALLGQKPAPTGELGVKAHFGGVDAPADAIGLFGVDHHYCGVAPIEGGRWNVAFSVPATRVAEFGGNSDRLFSAMCDENLALRQQFHRAGRVRAWVAAPLPRFAVQDDWPDHVIPLGNAAAALEPIGGEGIGLALRSAELAAGALIDANRRGTRIDTRSLRRQFNRLWRTRRFACRAAGFVMSSPNLAAAAAPIIDDSLPLKTMALALMGKA